MAQPETRPWFGGFDCREHAVNGVTLRVRVGGRADAPALLLLHGFPQTHVMWHRVAMQLAPHYRLVLPDLRGYGESSKPADESDAADHASYSKRAMAADMAALMHSLGHGRFFVAGHDRGGRVAHRLALDHAADVIKLCVLDIAPTLDMYTATDLSFASAYYHWFFLIQPAPHPERMISGDPVEYLRWKVGRWGAEGLGHCESAAFDDYARCISQPATVHAMCEDYRASAGIDLEHDRQSRADGAQVDCDMLVLWGQRGVVNALFDPLALWRAQCRGVVSGELMPCGHYIPEELPDATAQALQRFMQA